MPQLLEVFVEFQESFSSAASEMLDKSFVFLNDPTMKRVLFHQSVMTLQQFITLQILSKTEATYIGNDNHVSQSIILLNILCKQFIAFMPSQFSQ